MSIQRVTSMLESAYPNLEKEEMQILYYGLVQGLFLILNMGISLIIGFALGVFYPGICTIILFYPLRIYAGGYHAKTRRKCFFLSLLMVTVMFLILRYREISWSIAIPLLIVMCLFIWMEAPMDNANKKISKDERERYKRKIYIILSIHMMVFLLGLSYGNMMLTNCVILAQGSEVVLLVAGKLGK